MATLQDALNAINDLAATAVGTYAAVQTINNKPAVQPAVQAPANNTSRPPAAPANSGGWFTGTSAIGVPNAVLWPVVIALGGYLAKRKGLI